MTLRHKMLKAARTGTLLLGTDRPARWRPAEPAEARHATIAFLRSRQNPDGGFRGRAAHSDLYYTVFALDALTALGAELPREPVARYLSAFGYGEGLDLVHLACLARCWAALGEIPAQAAALRARLEAHRANDGAYAPTPSAQHGTAYACFLALGAYEDLSANPPDPAGVIRSLGALKRPDGGYANEAQLRSASTPATAAAVTLLRHLGQPVAEDSAAWLLARHGPDGGFRATPAAPMPDLLSTATALHALAAVGALPPNLAAHCRDFIASLRTDDGGYRGAWLDDVPDAEYTFYALLALGHLTEA